MSRPWWLQLEMGVRPQVLVSLIQMASFRLLLCGCVAVSLPTLCRCQALLIPWQALPRRGYLQQVSEW